MGNAQSSLKFYNFSKSWVLIFGSVNYTVSSILALISLSLMWRTQGCKNTTLLLLLVSIFIDASAFAVAYIMLTQG